MKPRVSMNKNIQIPAYKCGGKKKSKKAPAHAFGLDQSLGLAQLFGAGLNAFGGDSRGYGDMEAVPSSLSNAGSAIHGASAGASVGMAAGPIGAAAGGLIGGVGSLIGRNKQRKAIKRRNRMRKTQNLTNAGFGMQSELENDYYDENQLAYTYANGGMLSDSLAYVDNNEILRDAEGNMMQVPNTKSGTDEHLIDSSTLDAVLSDKLKRPGKKQTFADAGKDIMKKYKPSKGNDRFAEATNQLNRDNANKEYDDLLLEQELLKQKRGIKPQSKGIPAYKDGVFRFTEGSDPMLPEVLVTADAPIRSIPGVTVPDRPQMPTSYQWYKSNLSEFRDAGGRPSVPVPDRLMPDLGNTSRFVGIDPYTTPYAKKFYKDRNGGGMFGKFNPSDLLSLTPTLYNWAQGRRTPEYDSPVTNPYEGAINRTMASRRMNVNPIMDANRTSRSIANYNASNLNSNTGANLALRAQMATDEYRNNANMFATKQNADNQYIGEYGNMLNNLGQQRASAITYSNDVNAKNRAAGRNYTANAASQIGQWSQVQQQMNNQRNRDDMVMPFLGEFMKQGYTKKQVQDMLDRYYR